MVQLQGMQLDSLRRQKYKLLIEVQVFSSKTAGFYK